MKTLDGTDADSKVICSNNSEKSVLVLVKMYYGSLHNVSDMNKIISLRQHDDNLGMADKLLITCKTIQNKRQINCVLELSSCEILKFVAKLFDCKYHLFL